MDMWYSALILVIANVIQLFDASDATKRRWLDGRAKLKLQGMMRRFNKLRFKRPHIFSSGSSVSSFIALASTSLVAT